MRQPYAVEYYEERLRELYKIAYLITPLSEWHGLRTWVEIHCPIHYGNRIVYLKKIFNGKKSTHPCRQCVINDSDT